MTPEIWPALRLPLIAASILAVLAVACATATSPTKAGFAEAIEANDLDTAWGLLEPPTLPEEPLIGYGIALTRAHFDAAYQHAAPTGNRSATGNPIYRWPDGTEKWIPVSGDPGEAGIVADQFNIIVYGGIAPTRTLIDGIPVIGNYTDESWTSAWQVSVLFFPADGIGVTIELPDGTRMHVDAPEDTNFVEFDPRENLARAVSGSLNDPPLWEDPNARPAG